MYSLILIGLTVGFVPGSDIIAIADKLMDQAVQRKSNKQNPASNVDVFFEH